MSESQPAKVDKLSAARRKLKEFQEQKKLREKSNVSQSVNNEIISTPVQDHIQQNILASNENKTSDHHLNGTNANTIQYFMPNTQQPLVTNGGQPINNNQGYYNLPPFGASSTSNVLDTFLPTDHSHQNSNVNASVNMQAYFSDNIFQTNNSIENFNTSPPNYETLTNSQIDSNFSQNVNNLDNVNNVTRKLSSENANQNIDFTFHQSNNVNYSVSPDTNKNNVNIFTSNENNGVVFESGNGPSPKDIGSTNHNILSVFTDSSTTSSHTSSTHTGPFLLNEEIPQQLNNENSPQQLNNNENSPQQFNEGSNRNSEPPEEVSQEIINANANNSYHLFEQTHNENYFGINFGNDEGPGIHMNINPFEHRNEKMVSDFLDSESKPDQSSSQESSVPSDELRTDTQEPLTSDHPLHTPINLLNDTFRRNLLSLSTSKSTSIEEYTDKSTRGTSTVSKSVSLESSAGGGVGERGGVYDDLLGKDSTNSSTVFSSCDNLRKLLSSAAESSSEPACTNSQCEEACLLELEKKNEELRTLLAAEQEKNGELRALLTGEQGKTSGLEAQVNQLKNEIHALRSSQSEQGKHYVTENETLHQKLKSQTHTIQILIEEKAELEGRVKSVGDMIEEKNREIEELKGRLAISKHKCGNIERDVGMLQEQVRRSSQALAQVNEELTLERKQLEELAEDKTALTHKLDTKTQEMQQLQILLQERDSQLSLMHLKVQQLSATGGMLTSAGMSDAQSLQQERDALKANVDELSEHVKTLTRERDKTVQYHVHMIDSLKAQMEELSGLYRTATGERSSLQTQCENQIQHISDLERTVQNLRQQALSQSDPSADESALKPLVAEMETKIKELSLEKQKMDTMLQAQILETELAQERVDQLGREIERLEADRPDATALLSAMESDKIAASRAVQQNSDLKRQLQELQDALITLNNSKLELSEQLSQEQVQSNQLRHTLETLQQQLTQQDLDQQQRTQQEIEHRQQPTQQQIENQQQNLELVSSDTCAHTSGESSVPGDQNAVRLLEAKFKAAMTDLAELSDEKQRLEHLVTQLQLETETIGEYAALYQKQRYLLQQKSREKDEQVKQLSQDQEALKQKLAKLNALVQEFVTQGTLSVKEALLESGETAAVLSASQPLPTPAAQDSKASQIMELISEIEANSLVDGGVPSSFHPCPVCSGQLITV